MMMLRVRRAIVTVHIVAEGSSIVNVGGPKTPRLVYNSVVIMCMTGG